MLFIENGKTLPHSDKQTALRMKYGHDNKDNARTEYRIDELKQLQITGSLLLECGSILDIQN